MLRRQELMPGSHIARSSRGHYRQIKYVQVNHISYTFLYDGGYASFNESFYNVSKRHQHGVCGKTVS
jgi:hypothetical protein